MDNEDKTFDTICRVCLNHGKAEKMVSLIDDSCECGLSPYGISFEKLTKISVKQNIYLPVKICQNCKKSLEMVATFMIRSETGDKKLAKLVNFSRKQDLNDDMVQEVIRQYTLFNQNYSENSLLSCNQSTTSQNIDTLQKKNISNSEKQYPSIKMEVDVQQISSDSDDSVTNEYQEKPLQSNSDNVDIFLYSIEKLVTTKLEDLEAQIKSEPKKKKQIKPKVSEQNLTCHICQRVLANPATYKHHIERHGICKYVCDQCGKGFPVLAELNQHQIYRHGIGSTLECDQCAFKAARRLELIEHIRLHTGERPFTCEKCGLTFRRKAIYSNHMKSHEEKTVSCDYCPHKFLRRSQMLAHSNNVHNRVYVFLCKVCNVTYAMAKTVRRHMLNKHGIARNLQGKVIRINKSSDSNFSRDRDGPNECLVNS